MDELSGLVERLAKLETKVCLTISERDKALILSEKSIEKHFMTVNRFQERIDKAEATYANKDYVRDQLHALDMKYGAKIDALQKLFYALAAVAAALELYFRLSK